MFAKVRDEEITKEREADDTLCNKQLGQTVQNSADATKMENMMREV